MIEKLNQEWKGLRTKLEEERLKFDEQFRANQQNHECSTKVYAWNGNWFCKHMTKARNRKFKNEIQRTEIIIDALSTSLINEKFI